MKFIERTGCECCGGKNISSVLDVRYTDLTMLSFLDKYYDGNILKEDLEDARFSIENCADCGFLFQKYILDGESSSYFYNDVISGAASLQKREKAASSYFEGLASSVKAVRYFFPEKSPRSLKVLDFGMGWGHWALMAKAFGYDAYGAELSKDRIDFAKSLGVSVVGDVRESDESYDFINTDQVFEHLDHPFLVAEMLAARLNKGGVLKVFTPSSRGVLDKLKSGAWSPAKDAIQPIEHINCFAGASMDILFSRVGLVPARLSDFRGIRAKLSALRLKYLAAGTGWFYIKR